MLWKNGGISQRRNMLTVAYVCTSNKDFIVYVYLSYPTTKLLEVHTLKKMDKQINQYDYHSSIYFINIILN